MTTAQTFLQDENEKLQANPETKPQSLVEAAALRNQRFGERLLDLQTTGQPDIPRLVGHAAPAQPAPGFVERYAAAVCGGTPIVSR